MTAQNTVTFDKLLADLVNTSDMDDDDDLEDAIEDAIGDKNDAIT